MLLGNVLALSVIAARCHTPPFVAARHLPPERGKSFLKGRGKCTTGNFLIAPNALVPRLTACALSVTFGDSSPKGRAKSTAGNFLIAPNTLVMNFTAWLSLRESWRGSA